MKYQGNRAGLLVAIVAANIVPALAAIDIQWVCDVAAVAATDNIDVEVTSDTIIVKELVEDTKVTEGVFTLPGVTTVSAPGLMDGKSVVSAKLIRTIVEAPREPAAPQSEPAAEPEDRFARIRAEFAKREDRNKPPVASSGFPIWKAAAGTAAFAAAAFGIYKFFKVGS